MNTRKLLENGLFLSIEISPSLNKKIDFYLSNQYFSKIKSLISNIIITDSPLGKYTHNPILTASYIKQQTGISTIATFAMRDKNTPYSLAEIRTAEELGLNKYMFVTGDKTKSGKNVFEKNSTEFMKDVCLQKRKHSLNTLMFSTCSNILTSNVKKKIKNKVLNGADVIVSQPITEYKQAIELQNYIEELNKTLNLKRKITFVAGIFPIVNLKTAIFIKENVPGANVSDELFELLKKDNSINEVFEFNKQLIEKLINNNFNIHLMTANNFELMFKLLKYK
jgi:homocysteine S-methyltransferase